MAASLSCLLSFSLQIPGGHSVQNIEVMFDQALENHTLNADILLWNYYPFHGVDMGVGIDIKLKTTLLTNLFILSSIQVSSFTLFDLLFGATNVTKPCKNVGLQDLYHVYEIDTLNADTWRPTAEQWALFPQNGVRADRDFAYKRHPFRLFFSNMSS